MDSKKHAEFTHSPAIIDRKVGGEFITFDGWASGTTLELIPDKKIEQKWRAADWPARLLFDGNVRAEHGRPRNQISFYAGWHSRRSVRGSRVRVGRVLLGQPSGLFWLIASKRRVCL